MEQVQDDGQIGEGIEAHRLGARGIEQLVRRVQRNGEHAVRPPLEAVLFAIGQLQRGGAPALMNIYQLVV